MARLLVVDDDAPNRLLARHVLAGHEVLEAANGPTALALIEREPVDLVLLDVMMPGMSGLEVCRAIKARPCPAYLPVILLTALSDQADRNTGLEAGADEFLTKPFDRRELRLRVATFLRLREQDRQIRGQLEALQELGQLKDDLVSLLLHDVRNPLAAAVALLELIALQVDPEVAPDVRLAQQQCERMRGLLEDVLAVRELEDGRGLGHQEPSDISALVERAALTLQPVAGSKGASIAVQAPAGSILVVDPALVQRAIENLLSNAVKFAPPGSEVEVCVRRAERSVTIEVADRGPGIATPVRSRLFEKFGTVGKGGQAGPRGFGLGLYLVRLVADGHGGEVVATDRDGGGTVFRLTLRDGTR